MHIKEDLVVQQSRSKPELKIDVDRWGDSPLRWIECLLFLDIQKEVAQLDVHYGQDKRNSWEPPVSWGLAGTQRRLSAGSP